MKKPFLKKKQGQVLSAKTGLPPGTLIHIGELKTTETKIKLLEFRQEFFEERKLKNLEDCAYIRFTPVVSWVDISGLQNIEIIRQVGEIFGHHELHLEDILNTEERPKVEFFEDYIFFTLKVLSYNDTEKEIDSEQLSFLLSKNYIISFQEIDSKLLDPVRDRIKSEKGIVRSKGTDYLAYCLLDVIVDNYYTIVEIIGDTVNQIEDQIFDHADRDFLYSLQNLKNNLLFLRKHIFPLREAISKLQDEDTELINKSTYNYLNDVQDHTTQITEEIENYREMIAGLRDIYLSSLNQKMNQVMKMLTIISTIFIPLTFIVGVYGMNFKYMPELEWRHGYYLIWIIIFTISVVMIIFFWRKRWL